MNCLDNYLQVGGRRQRIERPTPFGVSDQRSIVRIGVPTAETQTALATRMRCSSLNSDLRTDDRFVALVDNHSTDRSAFDHAKRVRCRWHVAIFNVVFFPVCEQASVAIVAGPQTKNAKLVWKVDRHSTFCVGVVRLVWREGTIITPDSGVNVSSFQRISVFVQHGNHHRPVFLHSLCGSHRILMRIKLTHFRGVGQYICNGSSLCPLVCHENRKRQKSDHQRTKACQPIRARGTTSRFAQQPRNSINQTAAVGTHRQPE